MINLILSSLFILIPAALPIFLIYKITKKSDNRKKDIINAFSIAFFLPLMNFIFLWYSKIHQHPPSLYPYLIGFTWLCIILPVLFVIAILIPKKYFSYKKWSLLTILLTGIMGWF